MVGMVSEHSYRRLLTILGRHARYRGYISYLNSVGILPLIADESSALLLAEVEQNAEHF